MEEGGRERRKVREEEGEREEEEGEQRGGMGRQGGFLFLKSTEDTLCFQPGTVGRESTEVFRWSAVTWSLAGLPGGRGGMGWGGVGVGKNPKRRITDLSHENGSHGSRG